MINGFLEGFPKVPGKIGLALGSGSARGWAHIGVIRALSEAGIQVDYVAGTSIGALVGAVYAAGNIDTLEEVVLEFDWKQIAHFFDVVFPKSGLLDGKKVADFVRGHVQEKDIEELAIPFRTVSTDLVTGREVILKQGDIIEAVRASISVPGIFTPVKRNGAILVDGGMVNPVPVSVVREMGADFVIAVDLDHDIVGENGIKKASVGPSPASAPGSGRGRRFIERSKMISALSDKLGTHAFPALSQINQWRSTSPLPNIFEVMMTSTRIMQTQISLARLKADPPDLLIRPNLGHLRLLEFNRAQEAIAEGYREAQIRLGPLTVKGGQFGHS